MVPISKLKSSLSACGSHWLFPSCLSPALNLHRSGACSFPSSKNLPFQPDHMLSCFLCPFDSLLSLFIPVFDLCSWLLAPPLGPFPSLYSVPLLLCPCPPLLSQFSLDTSDASDWTHSHIHNKTLLLNHTLEQSCPHFIRSGSGTKNGHLIHTKDLSRFKRRPLINER